MKIDFIIIGANKCGTTWLAKMLNQHKKVFIPEQKELHYFNGQFGSNNKLINPNRKRGDKRYEEFFVNAKKNQIKGDATPVYLFDKKAPENIYKHNPDVKLLAIIRNPIERSFSQYLYFIQKGIVDEKTTFMKAIKNEYDSIIGRSLYYEQIKRYLDFFPNKNISILFHDDLKKNNKKLLEQSEIFLGIDKFIPENINERINVTGTPKYKFLKRIIYNTKKFLIKHNMIIVLSFFNKIGLSKISNKIIHKGKSFEKVPSITTEEKEYLTEIFKRDIANLEKLLDKDLSKWK